MIRSGNIQHTCPPCHGSGEVNITVTHVRERMVNISPILCYTCHGVGVLSRLDMARYHARHNMWCRCDRSPSETYHKDTPSSKHHYTCDGCGKVSQVG